jgi:hypothetical protein
MDGERVTALVYPTIRRKAALIGEAQGGSNCQLSPTTGLPALSVPAGFTADGLPVGIELVGRAFSEPDLLKLGAAFERAMPARRPPTSTPALTAADTGSAVRPTGPPGSLAATSSVAPTIRTSFRQPGPNVLSFDVSVEGLNASDMLLLALHREPPPNAPSSTASPAQAGYLIARLLRTGDLAGRGEITLRDSDRDDLAAGRLRVRLFTRQRPFGVEAGPVVIEKER